MIDDFKPLKVGRARFDPPLLLLRRFRAGKASIEATRLGLSQWGWSADKIATALAGRREHAGLPGIG